MSKQDKDKEMLSSAEVQARLGVSRATLSQWRKLGRGPTWVAVTDRCYRYPIEAFHAWLATRVGRQA